MKLLNEKKAMDLFMQGDILGLEEIKKQIIETGNSDYSNILDLLDLTIKMNFIVVETEMERYASDFNIKAMDLYVDMKNELFKNLEIDIDYYWNK